MAISATLKTSGHLNPSTSGGHSADGNLPSVSVTAGNLLVVILACTMDAGGNGNPLGMSASGYTFTEITRTTQTTQYTSTIKAMRATIPSTGSVVVAVTDAVATYGIAYWVFEVSGHDTSTPIGGIIAVNDATVDGLKNITLNAAPASGDYTFGACFCDSDAATSNSHIDVGSGFTEASEVATVGQYGVGQAETRTGSTSTTVGWADLKPTSAPTLYSFAGLGFVVKAAAGSTLLTVANSGQAQSSESPTLSTGSSLAVANSGQTQASGSPALTQHQVLVVAGSGQAQTSQNVVFLTGRFPVAVDATGRYWEDQHGDPWFGVGDAAWSMIAQLTNAEITTYLEDRAARGINFVLVNLIEKFFADNAPNNVDNVAPFTGTILQSSLNNTYWLRVDHALSECLRLGITMLACPAYLGNSDSEGFGAEVAASYAVSSGVGLTNYGAALTARYPAASYPNLVYLIGHDRTPSSTLKAAEKLIADQLTGRLLLPGGTLGTGQADWSGSGITWDGDTVYSYSTDPASPMLTVWGNDAGPGVFLEGGYEGEAWSSQNRQDRREALYGSLGNGATGAFFGNFAIWRFSSGIGTDWTTQLASDGSLDLERFAGFVAAIGGSWAAALPDLTNTFQTSGSGNCRFSSDIGLIYTTTGATVDLTEISGSSALVRWFDPTDGTFTTVGTYSTSGSQVVSDPGANSAGAQDWVLVVEPSGSVALTVANSGQAQASGSPALTQHQVLAVQGSGQAQASGSPALVQHQVLAVDSSVQAQASTSPALTQHQVLAVDGSSQAQASATPALTQHQVLAVDSSAQGQASANVTLTVAGSLAVQDSTQAQTSGTAALVQHQVLVVQSSTQGQVSEQPTLGVGAVSLTVANSAQTQASGSPALTQHQVLAAAGSTQAQTSATPTLTQHHVLVVQGSSQAQTSANVQIGSVVVSVVSFGPAAITSAAEIGRPTVTPSAELGVVEVTPA